LLPKLKLRKPHDLIRSSGTVESRTRKRPAFCVSSIFGGAFLLYSQALICHFNAPRILALRGAIAVLGYAAIAVAVLGAGSLRYELFLSDITCGLLLVAAMVSICFRLRAPVDKALFAASEGLSG
jgi:formate/nitrite transporter FocA (FNT family)